MFSSAAAAASPPWCRRPDEQRILRLLEACCSSPSRLQQIQAHVLLHGLHRSTWVASAFIAACKNLHLIPSALLFFHSMPGKPHVYVCNSLLRALVHPLPPSHAWPWSSTSLFVYTHMLNHGVRPNNYTFPLILKSLSDLQLPRQGCSIHAQVVKVGHASDIYVQNSLLNLYSSCGEMDLCQQLFDEMCIRDPVSWTTMIEGYRKARRLREALITFERMQISGPAPNMVTMVNALAACAECGDLEMGTWIHDCIRRKCWPLDVVLGTSLVDMYGKCGRVEDSLAVFCSMVEKNVYTWNALIQGLSLAKSGEEALTYFSQMEKEGIQADAVTLIVVLSACSHSGLVDAGRRIFRRLLDRGYGFAPGIKHYGCVVDMLGRAGLVEEALEIVEQMPEEPNAVIYGSLLVACKRADCTDPSFTEENSRRSEETTAKRLVELEPRNGAGYVLLSNLYASTGRWSLVEQVRRLMAQKLRKAGKEPSSTWVAGRRPCRAGVNLCADINFWAKSMVVWNTDVR